MSVLSIASAGNSAGVTQKGEGIEVGGGHQVGHISLEQECSTLFQWEMPESLLHNIHISLVPQMNRSFFLIIPLLTIHRHMLNIKTHLDLVYKKKIVVFTIVINPVVPVKCTNKSYTSL